MHFFDDFGVPSLMESICHQLRMTGASWHGLPAPPGTTGRLQWLPLPLPHGKCLSRFGCLVLIVVFKSVGLKFLFSAFLSSTKVRTPQGVPRTPPTAREPKFECVGFEPVCFLKNLLVGLPWRCRHIGLSSLASALPELPIWGHPSQTKSQILPWNHHMTSRPG